MMESLARLSGDVDALLAVKVKDLSGTYQFLQIVGILKQAGRIDEAVSWAEKGIAAFVKNPDSRLEACLAELYVQQKEFDKAITFAWKPFERQPSLHHWQLLKDICAQAECQDGEWRQRALDEMRRQIVAEKNRGGHYWRKPDHSLLVEIFLYENEMETAWQEANDGGCNANLWRALGQRLGDVDPLRAAFCWQRLVEPTINQKNNGAYDEAVQMMLKVGKWMQQAGKEPAFRQWIQEIRMRHKPKRNLMQRMQSGKL